ncbi:MAG: hypothetical protein J6S67_13160 [Methanobrevibacter sp.]|nr:hypothetical protein [Methanobrevibacter sp.]
MPRAMTPQDVHAVVNLIVQELSGQDGNITTVNSSNFVSVGETILTHSTENVYNALSTVMGRTLVASRPYRAKLWLINALNSGMYTSRIRKISYYDQGALASGDFNTQLYTNLEDGFDNGENPSGGTPQSTKDQWEQHQTYPVELNFGGSSTMEFCLTWYEDQVKNAFRSEDEFARFWSGALTEYANQIEHRKEAFNRMTVLNFMAGIYDLRNVGCTAINLTTEYNNKYNAGGTPNTTEELLTTKYKEFLAFFIAEFKKHSRLMTERSTLYHNYPDKYDAAGNQLHLMRHTPYDRQRVLLYEPMFIDAEAQVLPEIFNPQYLDIDKQYEGVMFWQDIKVPAGIDFTPAVPNFTTGTQQAGNNVALSMVVGLLYDEDALMVDYQLETANTTPLEARKRYRNSWLSIARNAINDFTENACLFYMAD